MLCSLLFYFVLILLLLISPEFAHLFYYVDDLFAVLCLACLSICVCAFSGLFA